MNNLTKEEWKVYAHENKINNKKYIGITSRKYVAERWGKDGNGYEKNKHFWSAIKKYGWDNFNHYILADNMTKFEACDLEKELISYWKTNDKDFGYNKSEGGELTRTNVGDKILQLSVGRNTMNIAMFRTVRSLLEYYNLESIQSIIENNNLIIIKEKELNIGIKNFIQNSEREVFVYFNYKGYLIDKNDFMEDRYQIVKIYKLLSGKVKYKGVGFGCRNSTVIHLKSDFKLTKRDIQILG